METEYKIIMLPTDKGSCIGLVGDTKRLYHFNQVVSHEAQHLYILSNGEIKEGDWCYSVRDKWVNQCKNAHPAFEKALEIKKIIASTDRDITPNSWIPEILVADYISAYNQGKPIMEVVLEREYPKSPLPTDDVHQDAVSFDQWLDVKDILYPKIKSDGSVIINKVVIFITNKAHGKVS